MKYEHAGACTTDRCHTIGPVLLSFSREGPGTSLMGQNLDFIS
jgi:hypothetical protein